MFQFHTVQLTFYPFLIHQSFTKFYCFTKKFGLMSSTSLKFYVNKIKQNPKTGNIPIYCRLIEKKQKKEFRLPKTFDLKPSEEYLWNEMSQRLNLRPHPTNNYLNALELEFQKNLTFHQGITLDKMVELLQNDAPQKEHEPTLIDYLDHYLIEEIETPIRKEGTKKNYRNAFRQLKNFLRYEKIEKIKLKDFSYNEARKFKLYLEKEIEPNKLKGYLAKKISNSEVSSSTKVKNIKPVFKKALEQGLISTHPFQKISLCKTSEKSPHLTMQEIKKIADLDLSQRPELNLAKDIFMFMVYTGLSIIDTLNLSTIVIKEVSNGRFLLDTTRAKTNIQVRQILLRPAEKILKKYWNYGSRVLGERIFPSITDVDVNRKLKIIASYAGIPINLVTKTARITCREQIYEAKISESLLIDVYMGWRPSTTEKVKLQYLSITEQKLLTLTCELELHFNKVLNGVNLPENEVISKANTLIW